MNIFKFRRPNCEIGEVVVTVPAEFTHEQRKATETACRLVGLKRVTLLNEPTAAVLDYQRYLISEGKEELVKGANVLVIDFGGGTLDINCCEMKDNHDVTVVKNGGSQDLGGNNFDFVMQDVIKQKIVDELGIDDYFDIPKKATPAIKKKIAARNGRLRKEAEIAKIALSKQVEYCINLAHIFEGEQDEEFTDIIEEEIKIKRSEFEKAIEPLVKKFSECVRECTGKGRRAFTKTNVDLVLLVGGTSKMPIIKKELEKRFKVESFANDNFDPMTAVAKGACFYAKNLAGKGVTEQKVYDTIPFDIGLKVQQNKFLPMCKDGSPLPTSSKTLISTESCGQETVEFEIYCGNKMFVDSEGMKKECSFKITGLPKTESKISFEIELTVQDDGMLRVKAKSIGTETEFRIDDKEYQMDLRPVDRMYVRVEKHFKGFLPPPF